MPNLLEAEPLSPQQRAEIVLYVAESFPAADFMIAGRTGFGLAPTLAALGDMTESGVLISPYGNDYRINADNEQETYAEALPHATTEQLEHLDEVCDRPAVECLIVFGRMPETVYGPLQLAVKTELYARKKQAERASA